jgi:Uma2 family endonuclease
MLRRSPVDPSRFSYRDYLRWTGDERWELLDGEPSLMSPAPSRRHQETVVALLAQIAPYLRRGPGSVYAAPFDVRLPESDQADDEIATVVQPDVVVVCDRAKLDEAGCRGAPDWIIEVLSPTTEARDRVHKRDLYERHGVREYWLVDPDGPVLTIYRLDPARRRFEPPRIGAAEGTTAPAVLPGLAIDWELVFAG